MDEPTQDHLFLDAVDGIVLDALARIAERPKGRVPALHLSRRLAKVSIAVLRADARHVLAKSESVCVSTWSLSARRRRDAVARAAAGDARRRRHIDLLSGMLTKLALVFTMIGLFAFVYFARAHRSPAVV